MQLCDFVRLVLEDEHEWKTGAFHACVEGDRPDLLALLLDVIRTCKSDGCDESLELTRGGATPLFAALRASKHRCAEQLLAAGADMFETLNLEQHAASQKATAAVQTGQGQSVGSDAAPSSAEPGTKKKGKGKRGGSGKGKGQGGPAGATSSSVQVQTFLTSPLHLAAEQNMVKLVKQHLEAYCPSQSAQSAQKLFMRFPGCNRTDGTGNTALHVAAAKGHGSMCSVLHGAGMSAFAVNHDAVTPVLLAVQVSSSSAKRVVICQRCCT